MLRNPEADIKAAEAILRLDRKLIILTLPLAAIAALDIGFIKIWKTSWSQIVGIPGKEHPFAFALGIEILGAAAWAHLCVDWNDPLCRFSKRYLRD